MHTSGSFLDSVIEYARFILEEPAGDTQYSDAFVARQIIPSTYDEVMNSIALGQENPILFRYTISLAASTEYYVLPPCVRQVWRLGKIDTNGAVTHDWYPRGEFSPLGRGWSIEANTLAFSPIPSQAEDWTLWYVPSCDFMCHKGSGTVVGTARDTIDLAASPSLGILDQRPNAYAGAVLRVIHSGAPWQERVISSYDVATRRAVVRVPFATTGYPAAAAAITYEIAPIAHLSLWKAIACRTAFNLGVARNVSEKKLALIDAEYRRALKAIRDRLGNIQGRRNKGFDRMSYDSAAFTDPVPW